MTSEEKKNDLVKKFDGNIAHCIIAVKEIIKDREEVFHKYGIGFMGNATARNDFSKSTMSIYWNEVLNHLKPKP